VASYQLALRSCTLVALANFGAPAHAVSLGNTPGAVGWENSAASTQTSKKKCEQALRH
jgi:hypothetical protein